MATMITNNLGGRYATPESGFKRIAFSNAMIQYKAMDEERTWGRFGTSIDSSFTIYVKNLSHIRFLNKTESHCGYSEVEVNDELQTGYYYSNFTYYTEETIANVSAYGCCCEMTDFRTYTKIKIKSAVAKQQSTMGFDINEEAELITQEEYETKTSTRFLIKDQDKYYGLVDGGLTEVEDYNTVLHTKGDGVIEDIGKIIPFISSFHDGWKVVCNNPLVTLSVVGTKSNGEYIISKHNKTLKFANLVNSISMTANAEQVKAVVSFDNGLTWSYWEGEWKTLTNTAVKKNWEDLTEEEKILNNNFKEEIAEKGMTRESIQLADFTAKKDGTIEFAFWIGTSGLIKNLSANIETGDLYEILGQEDIGISKVLGKYIMLTPKRNIDNVIIEILTTGIKEES